MRGFNSNWSTLQSLINTNDIICIQEHWLHLYEARQKIEELGDVSSTASCFDSINPTIPTHRTRGEKGVAIIWKNKLEHCMTIKPVNITSTRVCAVTLQGPSSRSRLINVYLPSRGRDQSDNELKEALDIVSQVKDSHMRDHNIFICGDFNASLHREHPNSHDKILNHFCKRKS